MATSPRPPYSFGYATFPTSADGFGSGGVSSSGAARPGSDENVAWIDPERVPSWLRPFTLDSRTRFTRTPDSLLRPREAANGTPGRHGDETAAVPGVRSSWHFLVDETDEDADAASGFVAARTGAVPAAGRDRLAAGAVIDLAQGALGDDADDELVFAAPLPAASGWTTPAPVAAEPLTVAPVETPSEPSFGTPAAIDGTVAFDIPPALEAVPDVSGEWNAAVPEAQSWAPPDVCDGWILPEYSEAEILSADPEVPAGEVPADPVFAPEPMLDAPPEGPQVFDSGFVPEGSEVLQAEVFDAPMMAEPEFDVPPSPAAEPVLGAPALADSILADPTLADPDFAASVLAEPSAWEEPGCGPAVAGDDFACAEPPAVTGAEAEFMDFAEATGIGRDAIGERVLQLEAPDAIPLGIADAPLAADEPATEACAGDAEADALAGAAPPDMPEDDAVAEPAPSHIRRLAGLILVGPHVPAPAEDQDRAPDFVPVLPAAKGDAGLVQARFAWGAYPSALLACTVVPVDAAAASTVSPRARAVETAAEATPPAAPEAMPTPAAGADVAAQFAGAGDLDSVFDPAFTLPPIELLRDPPETEPDFDLSEEALDRNSSTLGQVLRDFGVRGEVIDANPGPVVTLYEFEPAPGIKSSRVIGLAADIARSMSALSVRVAVVEGRNVIGIELPNRRRETVWLREMLAHRAYAEAHSKLGLCLGKTIGGEPVIVDLARMPHLLVAGTTGSGKSVAINTMILSLLYRHTPETCRLIMIDPKMLELSVYEGIPHLLTPVVTDPKKAIIALKWAVKEMEDRYRKMSRLAVRNIDGFNARVKEAAAKGEVIRHLVQAGFDKENGEPLFEERDMDLTPLPYIVVVVDEMADLMMVAGKEIEGAIQRLAQMARAAGIHLIMATQRPSVDVITGTIKANFPTRISFQVTSKIDSRTILGEMGAEQLLGQGDMLYMAGGGRISRVHGPFVSDEEVEHVVSFLKAQGGPDYLDAVVLDEEAGEVPDDEDAAVFDRGSLGETGDLYEQAVAIVLRDRKASTSYIQRRLQVGYNKAASLMERMENEGIVGAANHAGKREILLYARPE